MAKTIKLNDHHRIVKDKVVSYCIDPKKETEIVITLIGGVDFRISFPGSKTTILNFESLDSIMNKD